MNKFVALISAAALALGLTSTPGAITTSTNLWSSERLLSAEPSFVGHDIAVSGSTVHAVHGYGTVLYHRSTDNGTTWSNPVGIASGRVHLTRMIEADNQDVWVFYLRDGKSFKDACCQRNGAGNIYIKRSRDGGVTWDPEIKLTTGALAFRIHVAVSGDQLHIVWGDYRSETVWDVYYLRSLDRGTTWENEVKMFSGGTFGAGRPQITAAGNLVYITWGFKEEGKKSDFSFLDAFSVYYKRSIDNGATWGPDVLLTPENAHSLRSNVATVAPNIVVVSFDDDRDGLPIRTYARRSTDNGVTWEPARQIASAGGGGHNVLVSEGSMMHLAWWGQSTGDVFYRLSTDGGVNWQPEERMNEFQGSNAVAPLLAASSNYVHAIWLGDQGGGRYSNRNLLSPTKVVIMPWLKILLLDD